MVPWSLLYDASARMRTSFTPSLRRHAQSSRRSNDASRSNYNHAAALVNPWEPHKRGRGTNLPRRSGLSHLVATGNGREMTVAMPTQIVSHDDEALVDIARELGLLGGWRR